MTKLSAGCFYTQSRCPCSFKHLHLCLHEPPTSDHFNLIWVQECDRLQRVRLPLRPAGTLQWKMTWHSIYYSKAPMTNIMHEGKQVWRAVINVLRANWWEANVCLVLPTCTFGHIAVKVKLFPLALVHSGLFKINISLCNTQIFF